MIAAIMVAAGAIQPASASINVSLEPDRHWRKRYALPAMG
jgi:hypothetical protein